MNRKVNKKGLESGKVLLFLKERFLSNPTREFLLQFFDCLTDSKVYVPMNAVINKSTEDKLKCIQKGDTFKLDKEIRMKPDWLKKEGVLYFPIFCNVEEATEEYSKSFLWINLTIKECLNFVDGNKQCKGIVLDAFTNSMEIKDELLDVLKDIIKLKEVN